MDGTKAPLVPIEPPLAIVCYPVDQGRVARVGIDGYVERASREMLQARLECRVEPRSTVLITFNDGGPQRASEIYGTLERIEPTAGVPGDTRRPTTTRRTRRRLSRVREGWA